MFPEVRLCPVTDHDRAALGPLDAEIEHYCPLVLKIPGATACLLGRYVFGRMHMILRLDDKMFTYSTGSRLESDIDKILPGMDSDW